MPLLARSSLVCFQSQVLCHHSRRAYAATGITLPSDENSDEDSIVELKQGYSCVAQGYSCGAHKQLDLLPCVPQGNSEEEIRARVELVVEHELDPDSYIHNVAPGNL